MPRKRRKGEEPDYSQFDIDGPAPLGLDRMPDPFAKGDPDAKERRRGRSHPSRSVETADALMDAAGNPPAREDDILLTFQKPEAFDENANVIALAFERVNHPAETPEVIRFPLSAVRLRRDGDAYEMRVPKAIAIAKGLGARGRRLRCIS